MGFFDRIGSTDSHLSAETNKGRADKAAASDAARGREAEASRVRANKLHTMVAGANIRTDDDITDEVAGFARPVAAASSKARKSAEAKALAASNQSHKQRVATASSGMDTDITDEGARRANTLAPCI